MKWKPVFLTMLLLTTALMSGGCSTTSNRMKTLILMGGAATTVGTVGAALTPVGENPVAHGAMWGALGAASAGAAGLFIFDEEARCKGVEARNLKLEKELAAFREEMEPKLIASNRVGVSKPLPEKFRNLVTPGEWSLYRVDRWVTSGDSELVHQDMFFRFQQPQLNPAGRTKTSEGSNDDEKR